MYRSSQTIQLASPIVTVWFPAAYAMEPLTTTEMDLAADVERYLQRRLPHQLAVTADTEGHGTVRHGGRLVTTFRFAPLGSPTSREQVAA